MKNLILDFLRRWWWLWAIALAVSLLGSVIGFGIIFGPAAVIALLFDGNRGVYRVVRSLPVSQLDQARAGWFVGVPLLLLLTLPVLALGVLINRQLFPPPAGGNPFAEVRVSRPELPELSEAPFSVQTPGTFNPLTPPSGPGSGSLPAPAPWFLVALAWWVALGHAAFGFLLLQWAPVRPPENLRENVQQGLFGGLWGLTVAAAPMGLMHLPRLPNALVGWHGILLVAVPFFVVFSYWRAAAVVRHRLLIGASRPKPATEFQREKVTIGLTSGLTGVPLYVLSFAGRIGLLLILVGGVQSAVARFLDGGVTMANHRLPLVGQTVVIGLMVSILMTESLGLRALRVLPLSTTQLALLLGSLPWVGGLGGVAFAALVGGAGNPQLSPGVNFLSQAVLLCGWATFALATTLHLASGGRVFVLLALCLVPWICLAWMAERNLWLITLGGLSGTTGFIWLRHGLRHSAVFYRPRGFFGANPGPPRPVG